MQTEDSQSGTQRVADLHHQRPGEADGRGGLVQCRDDGGSSAAQEETQGLYHGTVSARAAVRIHLTGSGGGDLTLDSTGVTSLPLGTLQMTFNPYDEHLNVSKNAQKWFIPLIMRTKTETSIYTF